MGFKESYRIGRTLRCLGLWTSRVLSDDSALKVLQAVRTEEVKILIHELKGLGYIVSEFPINSNFFFFF